ncbi:MAG: metallophosphoesterase [Myxococcales bacterium]|nr:metallophosphoesterase [Myxococcales bacterium]MBL0195282.1 metallophosphoesterase [Myxococcales bacterium]HQY60416.1 metallophosphoesterase [Polyangiaceae bacterium]
MTDARAIFVGDTQATLWLERLIGREDNSDERARLLDLVAALDAEVAIFLGDLVARQSRTAWQIVDGCLARLRARGVRLAACAGNHDLFPFAFRGYDDLARRGLLGPASWQRVSLGDVRVLVLDTNRRALGPRLWSEQVVWFRAELADAEREGSVRAVVVASHHPPWTNSAMTGDSAPRLCELLEAFYAAPKARAWVSGHVHAYERFASRGKHLVVSGSASAPRMRLLTGARARHPTLAHVPAPSPFGWLELTAAAGVATLAHRGFRRRRAPCETFDVVTI